MSMIQIRNALGPNGLQCITKDSIYQGSHCRLDCDSNEAKEIIQQLNRLEAGGRFHELRRTSVVTAKIEKIETEDLLFDDQPVEIAVWLRSTFKDKQEMLDEKLGAAKDIPPREIVAEGTPLSKGLISVHLKKKNTFARKSGECWRGK